MNYVRFSGEWFIYYALIAFGGGILMGSTIFIFTAIGLDVEWLLSSWMLPCGAVGAVIIAGWLVEAKQSVIENMAPVLTMLFTPLFTLMLLAFLGTMVWTGSGINVEREELIGFDVLLVVVVGLVLYSRFLRRTGRVSPVGAMADGIPTGVCGVGVGGGGRLSAGVWLPIGGCSQGLRYSPWWADHMRGMNAPQRALA
jgi:hypothetical protein